VARVQHDAGRLSESELRQAADVQSLNIVYSTVYYRYV
jgi:hypothetical protein